MAIDRVEPGPRQESVRDDHGNEGIFYGGWITSHVVRPFKGGVGTAHW